MYIWALVNVKCWPWRKIRVALLDDQGKNQSKPKDMQRISHRRLDLPPPRRN